MPKTKPCPDGGGGAGASNPSANPFGGAPTAADDPLCVDAIPDVAFQRDVAHLVACSGEVCHPSWRYDTLVGHRSLVCCDHRPLVLPGSPSRSHLVQAVSGTSDCVDRMGDLSPDDIAKIVSWICEGAPDN